MFSFVKQMVEIKITYEGDLHCKAVHGPSGKELETDAPLDNMGKGETFSPTDLEAVSLGTCYLTTMGIAARNREIELKGAKARVEKHMSSDKPRRIIKLVVDIDMPPGIQEDKRKLLENIARNCPTAKSINPDIEVDLKFKYAD